VALALGVFALAAGDNVWLGQDVKRGVAQNRVYCEEDRVHSSVRTPINSWSNLAYIAAGGWVLGRAIEVWRLERIFSTVGPRPAALETLRLDNALPVPLLLLSGLSTVSLGLGSFFYHAALTRLMQQYDVACMYWVMDAAIAATMWRWLRRLSALAPSPWLRPRRLLHLLPLLLLVLAADLIFFYKKWDISATEWFSAQLAVVSGSEALHILLGWPPVSTSERQEKRTVRCCLPCRRPSLWQISLGLAALASGVAGWLIRVEGVKLNRRQKYGGFCNPASAFQPHSLWHVLTGLALVCLHELQLGILPPSPWSTGATADKDSSPASPDSATLDEGIGVLSLGKPLTPDHFEDQNGAHEP